MYAITYKGFTATIDRLNEAENYTSNGYSEEEGESYITNRTKGGCVKLYLYHFGFTWKERAKGVQCKKLVTSKRQIRHALRSELERAVKKAMHPVSLVSDKSTYK